MSKLNHREFKELDKLYKKSGFTKLSQQEQRRLERLEALSQDNKKGFEKEKWVNDRKSKKKHITPKSEAQQQSQAEQDMFDSMLEENTIEKLSDDELQDELDGLADMIKELKKEQSKRKRSTTK